MGFFQLEHSNNFACTFEQCSRRFRLELDLDIHMRKHRGEKPFLCKNCDKTFSSRQDLKTHNKQHVGKRQKRRHLYFFPTVHFWRHISGIF